ncbi:MAG: hypothetical protein ACSHXD_08785 [Marinosulfonomonas sp.]
MANIKNSLFVLFGAALFLGGCVQLLSTSSVYIDESYLTDEFRNKLVSAVYEKAEQLGGECKLTNSLRQVHVCRFEADNADLTLIVGYNTENDFRITVSSTYGVLFPQSEQKITSGYFIEATQKELEEWMRSLVPNEAIIKARRTYSNYDFIQEF